MSQHKSSYIHIRVTNRWFLLARQLQYFARAPAQSVVWFCSSPSVSCVAFVVCSIMSCNSGAVWHACVCCPMLMSRLHAHTGLFVQIQTPANQAISRKWNVTEPWLAAQIPSTTGRWSSNITAAAIALVVAEGSDITAAAIASSIYMTKQHYSSTCSTSSNYGGGHTSSWATAAWRGVLSTSACLTSCSVLAMRCILFCCPCYSTTCSILCSRVCLVRVSLQPCFQKGAFAHLLLMHSLHACTCEATVAATWSVYEWNGSVHCWWPAHHLPIHNVRCGYLA
eukprot:GHUV01017873.1.p1 GENE.GHUV01017873.1~~GHUV01017873.1.p1  ORF type:complete len:281 (+),score=44.75 GHUV01017873.1:872-1714(+)